MAIINGEELCSNSVLFYVKSYADSIFIVASADALMGVYCIGFYYSILFF